MSRAMPMQPWITGAANITPTDDMTRPNTLLQATFDAFSSSLLAGILPRLVLLAFTFARPFLVTATISYVETWGHAAGPLLERF